VLWAHLQDPPRDPSELRSDLTPEVKQALLTAMEKDADKRPASAGEYVRLLADAAGVTLSRD
jgi:hypothetical protein